MKREQLAFLLGGLAFGILIGVGTYHAVATIPELAAAQDGGAPPAPRGPAAPTQVDPNAAGGAPMVAEINRLKRQLQDSPDDEGILMRLANMYYDAAMWDQARGYYERALEVGGDNPDVLTDLGVCYRGLQQFDKALELFARAQKTDATHWQSLYNTIVVAVFDVGRIDLAVEALNSMEAIEPRPAGLTQDRLDQLREILERASQEEGQS